MEGKGEKDEQEEESYTNSNRESGNSGRET
jgi:hypothetical protein